MRAAIGFLLLVSCATLGTPGQGDVDLPSAGVGPFRKLAATEVLGVAPFVFVNEVDPYREPAVVALEDDASSTRVALYASTSSGKAIVRTFANDARSFYGTSDDFAHMPTIVLQGNALSGPSAIRVAGGGVWLYFADAFGIGLARSSDGVAFTKEPAPVISPGRAPSVARYPDGRWRMLYSLGDSIYEAESDDGLAWRALPDPVLSPSAPVDPSTLAPGEKPPFDTASVGDPCLLPRITPAGRLHVRVLYTGADATGATSIGFAARYADSGPLTRDAAPVYAIGAHERAPALFEWSGGSLLYVEQDNAPMPNTVFPAIAGGYSPPTLTLPTPAGYPN